MKGITRTAASHALNIRAVANKYANIKKIDIKNIKLIIAHLGGGVSIVPFSRGKIIDVTPTSEEGPFTTSRSGTLPMTAVIKLCYSGKYTEKEMLDLIERKSGLQSYLGTGNMKKIIERIRNGDKYARLIFDAMFYQISKAIAAMSAVLKGDVDAIIITGGMAYNKTVINVIKKRIKWIAPIYVFPGEEEMKALNDNIQRVFEKKEKVKKY